MKIFLLKGREDIGPGFEPVAGFVVMAMNHNRARLLASNYAGDEGSDFWMSAAICEAIGSAPDLNREHIVLRDKRSK